VALDVRSVGVSSGASRLVFASLSVMTFASFQVIGSGVMHDPGGWLSRSRGEADSEMRNVSAWQHMHFPWFSARGPFRLTSWHQTGFEVRPIALSVNFIS
jgi:hypothetical protein